jgi:hypothetical protein
MTDLERKLQAEAEDKQYQRGIQALAEGRQTAQLESGLISQDIQNLVAVRGAGEAEAERIQQKEILFSEQDYDAKKTQFQGDMQLALQSNDIEAVRKNLMDQLEFEADQAALGRTFTAEQNSFNRTLQENLTNLDIDSQREFINLKSNIDKKMLMSAQEFEKAQNELDRELEKAIVDGNIKAQESLLTMKSELDAIESKKAREHQATMQKAQNAYEFDVILNAQEFDLITKELDQLNNLALQSGDIAGQQAILTLQSNLELKQMTQGQDYATQQMILQSQLDEAMADNDLYRQGQIILYQTRQQYDLMAQTQGYDQANMLLQTQLQDSLNNNEYVRTNALQEAAFRQQASENFLDRKLKEAELAMEKEGIDMAKIQSQYNLIKSEIDAGRANPEDAIAFLNQNLPEGFELEGADPLSVEKAISDQYRLMQLTFAQTNPGAAEYNEDGSFKGLRGDYLRSFNDYYNKTTFGFEGDPLSQEIIAARNGDGLPANITKDSEFYTSLLTDPLVPNVTTNKASIYTSSAGNGRVKRIKALHDVPDGGTFKYGGEIFEKVGAERRTEFGTDETVYTVRNILTGKQIKLDTDDYDSIGAQTLASILTAPFTGGLGPILDIADNV